jgi:hypothetical protein
MESIGWHTHIEFYPMTGTAYIIGPETRIGRESECMHSIDDDIFREES